MKIRIKRKTYEEIIIAMMGIAVFIALVIPIVLIKRNQCKRWVEEYPDIEIKSSILSDNGCLYFNKKTNNWRSFQPSILK